MGLAGGGLERELAAFARRPPRHGRPRQRGALFGDGVPITAGVALALPAPLGGAAILADEGELAARHGGIVSESLRPALIGCAREKSPCPVRRSTVHFILES